MSNTKSIDMDIDNYNYDELLDIFKVKTDFNPTQLETTLLNIKEQFSKEIYMFYFKAYKILTCINTLPNFTSNNRNRNAYADKIKQIPNFQAYDTNQLISLIKIYKPIHGEKERKESTENTSNVELNLNSDLDQQQAIKQSNFNRSILNIGDISKTPGGPILNSFNYDVAPGTINSIKRVIQLQNLNMNSCFRTNYAITSSSDFQYLIPTEIKNVTSLRLASIEIPANSWYLFSKLKKNTSFTISFNNASVITKYLITIPDGNYTAAEMVYYLNHTYFYQSTNINELQYIEFNINNYSIKSVFKLTSLAPLSLTFSLFFFPEERQTINSNVNSMGWLLGFRKPVYLNIGQPQLPLYSEALFDNGDDRYLYVSLNDYQYNNNILNIVGFEKSIMDENIIAKIPMSNGKLSLIVDDAVNPLTKIRTYNGPVNIRNFQIKLLDMFGQVIDLNYMDYNFTLEMELLYECFSFSNVLP